MIRMTFFAAFLLLLVSTPGSSMAQTLLPNNGTLGAGCSFITGEFGYQCVPLYVAYLIQLIFGFTGGIALMQIMMAGYQIAMGGLQGGDTSGPRSRILWALIGLGVCVFSFLIIDTIIFALAR